MNCAFVAVTCPKTLEKYKCYRCKNCGKNISIVDDSRVNIEGVFAQFTSCSGEATAESTVGGAAYDWDPAGAGTQLKKLLSKIGIKSTENCSCNTRAKLMNANGIEWCEQNVKEIVGWLKEEAAKRSMPFLSLPAKIVVQHAIKMAKRARDKRGPTPEAAEPESSMTA